MSSKNEKSNWREPLYRGWASLRRRTGRVLPAQEMGMGANPHAFGTTFRVWAPNARRVNVSGDFNSWSRERDPLASEKNGYWSITIDRARGRRPV